MKNWKKYKDWEYPYNKRNVLTDPEYIKDRDEFFAGHNGWWWGNGWWNGYNDTVADRQRRARKRRQQ